MVMTTTALLLLLAVGLARAQECSECTGDDCKVLETVKVNKLCADELCVGGSSVVVGDGDPCTSDDIVDGEAVHLPIENCCAVDADCARWAPAPNCVLAECVHTEEVPTHGWCRFAAAPNCCAQDKDCPAQACKTAVCAPTEEGSLHYSAEHKRFVELAEHQLNNIPGQCVYSTDDDCCLTTRDCVNKCPPGTFGICDKGMTCQCVPSTDNECTLDSDCAADEAAKRVCEEGCEDETKPPCYYYECDRGWCTCKFDPDRDYDDDGVCCKNDCDDRDPDVQEKILCVVGTAEEVNADGDEFYLCGKIVEPTCNATCANGLPPVSPDDVVEINGELTIKYNCDCCDDNSAGLDQPLTCAKDANNNDANAPPAECLPDDFDCQQCYEALCVLQPESGKVPTNDTEALDALCVEAKGEGYSYYPLPADPSDAQCDFCDDVDEATSLTPTWMCPLEYTVGEGDDAVTRSVCPKMEDPDNQEYTTALLTACCEYILGTDSNDPQAHPQIEQLKACCAGLAPGNYDTPCGSCASAMGTLFPATCGRCECNNEWESPCNPTVNFNSDTFVQCVEDADGDKFYNCDEPQRICYSSRLQGPAADDDARCATALGPNFVSLATATQGVLIDTDGYTGTYCDCNDELQDVHELIICGSDSDNDGFLQCTEPVCDDGGYVARAPVCTQVCAERCAKPLVQITPQNCEPVAAPVRRRSTQEQVKEIAARHGWFDEVAAKQQQRKRQVELPPPREDDVCEELTCNNCDCCDDDVYAYPGSNFGTAAPNQCDNYDMNCDCMYHSTVACPNAVSDESVEHYYELAAALGAAPDDADDFSVGIRNLGNLTSPKYTNVFVNASFTATPDRLGYCGDDCANMCMDFVPGISLESKFGGPTNRRKRAISIELQKSCTDLVQLDNTNLDANSDVLTLLPGQCFEFIEACGTPCNTEGECNADCEICTKLWS